MARGGAGFPTWTPTAVADTTAFTDSGHHTLQGGTSTQRIEMREIYMGGQAGSSAPCIMVFGRTATVGATLTAGRLAALDPSTAFTSPPVSFQVSTTKPGRHATLGMLLQLTFNAFGGVIRWVNGPDEIISLLGNTASLGELSLNAFTGGTVGALASNFVFEQV